MSSPSTADAAFAPLLTEIVLRWQGRVIDVKRLLAAEAVTIGGGVDVDLFVPLEGGGNHELLSSSGALQLPPGAEVENGVDGGVVLGLGNHSIELRRTAQQRSPVVDVAYDAFWANVVVVVVLAGAALLAALFLAPESMADLDDDLMQNPTRFQTLVLAPRPRDNAFLDRMTAPRAQTTTTTPPTTTPTKTRKPTPMTTTAAAKPKRSNAQLVDDEMKALFGDTSKTGLTNLFGDDDGGVLGAALGDLKASDRMASSTGVLGVREHGSGPIGVGTLSGGPIGTRRTGRNGESWGATDGDLSGGEDRDVNVTSELPQVDGALDAEMVRRVVRSHTDQIRYCYERQLVTHPGLQGKVTVQWLIGPDGKVLRANVVDSSANDQDLDRCLTSKVLTWRFPSPRGGGTVVVNYPFMFRKSGG